MHIDTHTHTHTQKGGGSIQLFVALSDLNSLCRQGYSITPRNLAAFDPKMQKLKVCTIMLNPFVYTYVYMYILQ